LRQTKWERNTLQSKKNKDACTPPNAILTEKKVAEITKPSLGKGTGKKKGDLSKFLSKGIKGQRFIEKKLQKEKEDHKMWPKETA